MKTILNPLFEFSNFLLTSVLDPANSKVNLDFKLKSGKTIYNSVNFKSALLIENQTSAEFLNQKFNS